MRIFKKYYRHVGLVMTLTLLVVGLTGQIGLTQQREGEAFESGNLFSFPWRTGRDARWSPQFGVGDASLWAAQAGTISDDEVSWLEVKLYVAEDSSINFRYIVSSEEDHDFLRFIIDSSEVFSDSGNKLWLPAGPFPVSAGAHTFRWEYTKDGSGSEGLDTAWIDNIVFPFINVINVPAGGSIAEQIEDAPGGAIIRLQSGVYEGPGKVSGSFSLLGNGPAQTQLSGAVGIPGSSYGDNEVMIQNLTIQDGWIGMTVEEGEGHGYVYVELRNVTISNHTKYGLLVEAGRVHLYDCQIINNGGDGIVAHHDPILHVYGGAISSNGSLGLWLLGSGSGEIDGCTIANNGTKQRCQQPGHLCNGITLSEGFDLDITNSTITGNSGWGIGCWLEKCGYKVTKFHGSVHLDNIIWGGNGKGNYCGPRL